MNGFPWWGASAIREAVGRGEVSCEEVAAAHLERVESLGPRLNAVLTVTRDEALGAARRWDAARARGEDLPPLAGVPVLVKDNLCTRGVRTTCGSRILERYVPPYDATAWARLASAGAVLLGKANLDEFAMGSSNENSAFGPVANPWDGTRVPGGSSGGSAAGVASGMAPLALGSDTGGSVRQPAALCGAVGLKPTYGRVSRYGLVAFASSLDQVGPITRTVEDNALLLAAISGADARDATCAALAPFDPRDGLGDVRGLRVGLLKEHLDACDAEVADSVRRCARALEEGGASLAEASLPHAGYALDTYYILADAEASSNLARFDGVRFGLRVEGGDLAGTYEATRSRGFGPEVKRRILLGTYVLSAGYYEAYYLRAQKARTLCRRDFDGAFSGSDVLLGPTSPTAAFPVGAKVRDPLAMYLSDVCTIPASLGGFPALSVPCGFTGAGLPVGAQLVAPHYREDLLYRAGRHCERAMGLVDRHPEGLG